MGCTLIDQRNDVTFSKLYGKTTRLRLVLPPQRFEHIDVISMVDKSTDHEKLLSICYDQYLPGSLLELFKLSHEYHRQQSLPSHYSNQLR